MTEYLISGGPVMWLICAMGAVSCAVFCERALQLHRERIDSRDFLSGIFNSLRRGNSGEALALCEETPGPVARIVALAIRRRDESLEKLESDMSEAESAETARMERRLAILAMVSSSAPLAGLTGTLQGVFQSLLAYRDALPLADQSGIADGLALGLATTIAGLVVAIPAQLGRHVLLVKIDRLAMDIREAKSECLHFFGESNHDWREV